VSSLNPFRTLVRHRNFRLFWTGQTLSLVGTWMQTMAQGWLALQLTDDAFLVGLVASAGALPILLLSFPAGVLVERMDRLRVVRAMQSLMLLEAAALWLLTWTGHVTIGALLALAFANGVFAAFEIPARQALMAELVTARRAARGHRPQLERLQPRPHRRPGARRRRDRHARARLVLRAQRAQLPRRGRRALSGRLPARGAPAVHAAPLSALREGIRYLWRTPDVRALMGLVLVFAVFGTPYLTLMPVVARDVLGLGAAGYGALLAAVGVGGLAGALGMAALGSRVNPGRWLAGASFAFAALLVAFAFVRHVWVAEAVLLATGCAMILNGALANGLLQRLVPDALRGRTMAAYSFVVVGVAQVAGAFVGGAVARAVGVDWAIGGGGLIMLAYAGWQWSTRPALVRLGEEPRAAVSG
jgi:MFS family permease